LPQFERSKGISTPARAPRSCLAAPGTGLICPLAPLPAAHMEIPKSSTCVRRPSRPPGCHKDQRPVAWSGMHTGLYSYISAEVDFYPSKDAAPPRTIIVRAAPARAPDHLPTDLPLPRSPEALSSQLHCNAFSPNCALLSGLSTRILWCDDCLGLDDPAASPAIR
jgi:hypothetical protein